MPLRTETQRAPGRPIRVLHVRNCRGITTLTGPETYLLDLLAGMDRSAVDLSLLCTVKAARPSDIFIGELRRRNIPGVEVVKTGGRGDLSDWQALRRRLDGGGVDILQTHDARSNALGYLATRRRRLPWITFAHGWLNWESPFSTDRLYAAIEAWAVRRSDAVIVASRDMRRDVLARGVPPARVHPIPYGIDTRRFAPGPAPAALRSGLGIPAAAPLVGTVGRMHPWKGHGVFVEAAARVLAAAPDARFLVVGDAAFEGHARYREELEAHIKALGLGGKVILAGSRDDVPDVMRALDLFVLPSLREPFGIVLIEAQACGKAAIGSDVGGIPEAMAAGETGLLVAPGDGAALAGAILDLLGDEQRREAMGRAGRLRVEREFSCDAMVERTRALYEALVARPRAAEANKR